MIPPLLSTSILVVPRVADIYQESDNRVGAVSGRRSLSVRKRGAAYTRANLGTIPQLAVFLLRTTIVNVDYQLQPPDRTHAVTTRLCIKLTPYTLDDILDGMFDHDPRLADLLVVKHLHGVVPRLFRAVIPADGDPMLFRASLDGARVRGGE